MKKINFSISRNVLKEEEEEKEKRAYRGIICGEEFSFLFFLKTVSSIERCR